MPIPLLPRLLPPALLGSLCLLLASPGFAQTPERGATRVDSLRAARYGTPISVPATLTFTTGKQVPAFLAYALPLPTCFLDKVVCYETSPERIPPPPAKALSVERLKGMTVNEHRYEALYLKGKPLGLLAENLASAGPVELFGYAKTKNDMLVPIPLPMGALIVSTGTHDKYYWYVRTQGGPLLEVPCGDNEFAKVMSAYFNTNTALAARIQQKEKGARFNDMVELTNAFNGQPAIK